MANPYRDPNTGQFITRAEWEAFHAGEVDEEEDFDDLEEWDAFEEDEVY